MILLKIKNILTRKKKVLKINLVYPFPLKKNVKKLSQRPPHQQLAEPGYSIPWKAFSFTAFWRCVTPHFNGAS